MNRRRKKPAKKSVTEQLTQRWQGFDGKQQITRVSALWRCLPKLHQRLLMVLVPVLLLLLLLPTGASDPAQAQTEAKRVSLPVNTTGLSEQVATQGREPVSNDWQVYEIQEGDTLANVFRANQLPMKDLFDLAKVEGSDKPLSQIKQGQVLRYRLLPDGRLDSLELNNGTRDVLFYRDSNDEFQRER